MFIMGVNPCKLYIFEDLYQRRFETAPLRGAMVQIVTGN